MGQSNQMIIYLPANSNLSRPLGYLQPVLGCRGGMHGRCLGRLSWGPMCAVGSGEGWCATERIVHMQGQGIYPGSGPLREGNTPTPALLSLFSISGGKVTVQGVVSL